MEIKQAGMERNNIAVPLVGRSTISFLVHPLFFGIPNAEVRNKGPLPSILDHRAAGASSGPWSCPELSLLFPSPVARSGEPHQVSLRRAALLLYGRPRTGVEADSVVIEVSADGAEAAHSAAALERSVSQAVGELSCPSQTVCNPTLSGGSRAALAAFAARCSFIGAHEDQADVAPTRYEDPRANIPGKRALPALGTSARWTEGGERRAQ